MAVVCFVLLLLGLTNAKPHNQHTVLSGDYEFYENYNARVGQSTPNPLGITQNSNIYENDKYPSDNSHNRPLENSSSRGFIPDYSNSQNPTLGNDNSRGSTPNYVNLQNPTLENGNSRGSVPNYGNSQNPTLGYGNSRGSKPNYSNSQNPTLRNDNSRGSTPNYGNSQNPTLENGNSRGSVPNYGNSQNPTLGNDNSRGSTPNYGNSQNPILENGNSRGSVPNYGNSQNPTLGYSNSRGSIPNYGNSQNPPLGFGNPMNPSLQHGNPFGQRADYVNIPNPGSRYWNTGGVSTGGYNDRGDYNVVNIANGIGKTNHVLLLEGHGNDPDYIYATSQDRNENENNFIHAVVPNTGKTRITNIGHGFGNTNNVVITSNGDKSYNIKRKPGGTSIDLYNKNSNADSVTQTITTGQGKSNKSFFSFFGF